MFQISFPIKYGTTKNKWSECNALKRLEGKATIFDYFTPSVKLFSNMEYVARNDAKVRANITPGRSDQPKNVQRNIQKPFYKRIDRT